MEVSTEISYVARFSRLEAAKLLVTPGVPQELKDLLRAKLDGSVAVIDGETVIPQLTPGNGREPQPSKAGPSPYVKMAMRKLHKSTKKTACPHCGKAVGSLKRHYSHKPECNEAINGDVVASEPHDTEVDRLVAQATD